MGNKLTEVGPVYQLEARIPTLSTIPSAHWEVKNVGSEWICACRIAESLTITGSEMSWQVDRKPAY
jgi:hypothetical protein